MSQDDDRLETRVIHLGEGRDADAVPPVGTATSRPA